MSSKTGEERRNDPGMLEFDLNHFAGAYFDISLISRLKAAILSRLTAYKL